MSGRAFVDKDRDLLFASVFFRAQLREAGSGTRDATAAERKLYNVLVPYEIGQCSCTSVRRK